MFDYRSRTAVKDIIKALNGRLIAGALAIGTGSIGACLDIVHACKGNKFVSIATAPVPFDKAPSGRRRTLWLIPTMARMIAATAGMTIKAKTRGIRTKFIFGTALFDNEVGPMIYANFLPSALADGRYVAAPDPLVVGRGLDQIPAALEAQKNGVSAQEAGRRFMIELAKDTASVAPAVAGTRRKLSKAAWLGVAVLSAGVALFSYRYVAKVGPVPPNVASNRFRNPWIIVHAASAATALLLGPVQFLPALRRRWLSVHRWTGRTYVVGCLAGGASALVLAAGTSSGMIAGAGFGALGVVWMYVTSQGWRAARARRWPEHRRWMVRSFAMTFAAVTLRIYMPLAGKLGFDLMRAYPAIAWLCWVPNAVLAESYLRRGRASPAVDSIMRPSSGAHLRRRRFNCPHGVYR